MDSKGYIHMMDIPEPPARPTHTGFVTRAPMPEWCDARKVLAALDKLAGVPGEIPLGHPALAPLALVDRGYVLGVLAEYRAWRGASPGPGNEGP